MATAAAKAGLSGICWALNSTKDGCLASDDGSFARAVASVMREAVDHSLELRLGEKFVDHVIEKMREYGNATQLPEASGTGFVLVPGQKEPPVDERVEALLKQFQGAREELERLRAFETQIRGESDEASKRELAERLRRQREETERLVKELERQARPDQGSTIGDDSLKSKSSPELINQASAAFDAKRYEEAERCSTEALKLDPENARAKFIQKSAQGELEKNRTARRLVAEGRELLRANRPLDALAKARDAVRAVSDDEDAKRLEEVALKMQREIEVSEALRKMTAALREGWDALTRNEPEIALAKSKFVVDCRAKNGEAPEFKAPTEEAARLEDDALKLKEKLEIEATLREGWNLLNDGNSFMALLKANIVLARRPDNGEAQNLKRRAQLATTQSQPKAGTRMILSIRGVEYAFRWIPSGSFMMGEGNSQHKVNLSRGFWLLESPITQEMWQSIMGKNPSSFTGSDRLPVENISWKDCQKYIKKLNELAHGKKGIFSFSQGKPEIDGFPEGFAFSLPTEAEWEYACRAGTTTPYWFGGSLNGDKANCRGTSPYGTDKKGPYLKKTTEVGKYPANAWGLVDMHGNVGEWVQDWYGDYPTGEVTDPTGPEGGLGRVCRGGGWYGSAVSCRAASRYWGEPGWRLYDRGARLALRSQ